MKTETSTIGKTSTAGKRPNVNISKIGIANRDYNQEYNGYWDFTQSLEDIFKIFDDAGCDAILFSLFSICPRQGFSINRYLEKLTNIKLVLIESFEFGEFDNYRAICNHAYHKGHNSKKWFRYDYNQKFGSLNTMNDNMLSDFVSTEIPKRLFGNSLSLLCGETNIVKYSQSKKIVEDTYKLFRQIPEDVQIIVNPIHDRMTRFEMKLKRKFLSKNNRWVISVWNKGKVDKNGVIKDGSKPAWTAFLNEKEIEIKKIIHNLGYSIELGIVDTDTCC